MNNNYFLSKDCKSIIYYSLKPIEKNIIINFQIYSIYEDKILFEIIDTTKSINQSGGYYYFSTEISRFNFVDYRNKDSILIVSYAKYDKTVSENQSSYYYGNSFFYKHNQYLIKDNIWDKKFDISKNNLSRTEILEYHNSIGKGHQSYETAYTTDIKKYITISGKDTFELGRIASYYDGYKNTYTSDNLGYIPSISHITNNSEFLIYIYDKSIYKRNLQNKSSIVLFKIDFLPSSIQTDFEGKYLYLFSKDSIDNFFEIYDINNNCFIGRYYFPISINPVEIKINTFSDYFVINNNNKDLIRIKIPETNEDSFAKPTIQVSKDQIFEKDSIEFKINFNFCNDVEFLWDFGDNSYSNEKKPTHTYLKEGSYIVKLIIKRNSKSDTVSYKNLIIVSKEYKAKIMVSVNSGEAPLEVEFKKFSEGKVNNYTWDLGNGSSSNDSNFTYTYYTPGIFPVTLTMNGNLGSKSFYLSDPIEVKRPKFNIFESVFEYVEIDRAFGFDGFHEIYSASNKDVIALQAKDDHGFLRIFDSLGNKKYLKDLKLNLLNMYCKDEHCYLITQNTINNYSKQFLKIYDYNYITEELKILQDTSINHLSSKLLKSRNGNFYILVMFEYSDIVLKKQLVSGIEMYNSDFKFLNRQLFKGNYINDKLNFNNGSIDENDKYIFAVSNQTIYKLDKQSLEILKTYKFGDANAKLRKIKYSKYSNSLYAIGSRIIDTYERASVTKLSDNLDSIWNVVVGYEINTANDIIELNDSLLLIGTNYSYNYLRRAALFILNLNSLSKTSIYQPGRDVRIYTMFEKDNNIYMGGNINHNYNKVECFIPDLLCFINPYYKLIYVEESLENNQVIISPNPASDFIEISSPFFKWVTGVSIEIYNILGEIQELPRQDLSEGEGTIKIDISNLTTGIYFIKIGDKFEKFVKM